MKDEKTKTGLQRVQNHPQNREGSRWAGASACNSAPNGNSQKTEKNHEFKKFKSLKGSYKMEQVHGFENLFTDLKRFVQIHEKMQNTKGSLN